MSRKTTDPFDVFISYSRADNADGRVTALKGLIETHARLSGNDTPRVFFDTKDIRNIDDWRDRILYGLRYSKVLLVCLSSNYFASKYCQWEWEQFVLRQGTRRLRGDGESIQAVLLGSVSDSSSVEVKQWFESVRRSTTVDLRQWCRERPGPHAEDSEALACALSVVETLQERVKTARRELAREHGNIRAATDHFVGRRLQLQHLHEAVGVGPTGVITVLHGLGGIGKTELAVQYANEYARSFSSGIWWIDASGTKSLVIAISRLSRDPRFPQEISPAKTDLERFAHVLGVLRRQVQNDREDDSSAFPQALIVLDNVDHPVLLSASQRVHIANCPWLSVLATAGQSSDAWTHAESLRAIPVDSLELGDALGLIREWQPNAAFRSDDERDAATALVKDLGCFTLAVEQVAIFLGLQPGLMVRSFYTQLKLDGLCSLDDVIRFDSEVRAEIQHREKLLSIVLRKTIGTLSQEAGFVLEHASFWGAESIPRLLVENSVRAQLESAAPIEFEKIWRQLAAQSLVTPSGQPELVRMHGLIVRHVRLISSAESKRNCESALLQKCRSLSGAVQSGVNVEEWEIACLIGFAKSESRALHKLRGKISKVLVGWWRSIRSFELLTLLSEDLAILREWDRDAIKSDRTKSSEKESSLIRSAILSLDSISAIGDEFQSILSEQATQLHTDASYGDFGLSFLREQATAALNLLDSAGVFPDSIMGTSYEAFSDSVRVLSEQAVDRVYLNYISEPDAVNMLNEASRQLQSLVSTFADGVNLHEQRGQDFGALLGGFESNALHGAEELINAKSLADEFNVSGGLGAGESLRVIDELNSLNRAFSYSQPWANVFGVENDFRRELVARNKRKLYGAYHQQDIQPWKRLPRKGGQAKNANGKRNHKRRK